jgi:hypothetical protein
MDQQLRTANPKIRTNDLQTTMDVVQLWSTNILQTALQRERLFKKANRMKAESWHSVGGDLWIR